MLTGAAVRLFVNTRSCIDAACMIGNPTAGCSSCTLHFPAGGTGTQHWHWVKGAVQIGMRLCIVLRCSASSVLHTV